MDWIKTNFPHAIEFWEKYERHISAGGLAVGFFFDLIIADRPDSVANNLLLLTYLLLAGVIIIVLNLRATRKLEQEHSPEPLFLLLVLQFCFGGLASNLLVLYGRSGTLVGSALFLGLLLAMLVGNEFLKNRYAHLRFNVGVFYLLLLTYCLIAVPVFLVHTIGTWVFLLSEAISLIIFGGFLTVLFFVVFRGKERPVREIGIIVGSIFVVFNLFYFLQIIPPVPLSLKEIGVYHSILKESGGGYLAIYESPPWYVFWRDTSSTYRLQAGESAFCYSSVFAPTNLEAPIYHRWEYNPKNGSGWETRSRVSFEIAGGRNEGYRGYSQTSNLETGEWRCNVETQNGALIGRTTFTVVESKTPPALSQKKL
ncbi:DUF2914 domain-containing protein [Candidatus Parcubacteria bacterium]|nr:DUF2914 domain-containing protein [Candidatus Parcubacteria bacterium]